MHRGPPTHAARLRAGARPVRKDEHAKARASSGECCAAKGRNDAHSADAHAARVRSTVQADGLTLRAWGKSLHAGWRPHSARATPGTARRQDGRRACTHGCRGRLRASEGRWDAQATNGSRSRTEAPQSGRRGADGTFWGRAMHSGANAAPGGPMPPEGGCAKRGQPGYRPKCHARRIPPLPLVRD